MGEQVRSEYLASVGVVAQPRYESPLDNTIGGSPDNLDNVEHRNDELRPNAQLTAMEWIAELGSRESLSEKDQQLVEYLETSIAKANQLADELVEEYLTDALKLAEDFDDQNELAPNKNEKLARSAGETALAAAA